MGSVSKRDIQAQICSSANILLFCHNLHGNPEVAAFSIMVIRNEIGIDQPWFFVLEDNDITGESSSPKLFANYLKVLLYKEKHFIMKRTSCNLYAPRATFFY